MSSSQQISIQDNVRQFKEQHPSSHLLKIENFSLLRKHKIHVYKSTVFQINGYKWKLILYPNGNGRIEKDKGDLVVALDLELQDSVSNYVVSGQLNVFVINQMKKDWITSKGPVTYNISKPAWGSIFYAASLLDPRNGYLVNDCLLIGAEMLGIPPGRAVGTAECLTMIENPPNNKITWKITQFSTFNQLFHESHEFVFGQRKWKIVMYPKGYLEGEGNSLSVYLHGFDYDGNDSAAQTYAKFKLRILNQLHGKNSETQHTTWFPPMGASRMGGRKFMPLTELHDKSQGYLLDDKLYVQVQFEVVSVTKNC